MNIHDHVFTSSQVAKAADMGSANFRAQFTRNNWRIIGKERPGNGESHLFTALDVLAYALARRLMEYGFEAKRAFDLAMLDFAHTSIGDRSPGQTFNLNEYGRTFFVASMNSERGRCVAENTLNGPTQFLSLLSGGNAADVVIIDLSELQSRVFASLGLDSRDYE